MPRADFGGHEYFPPGSFEGDGNPHLAVDDALNSAVPVTLHLKLIDARQGTGDLRLELES